MGCPFEIPFPLGPVHLVYHKGNLLKRGKRGAIESMEIRCRMLERVANSQLRVMVKNCLY